MKICQTLWCGHKDLLNDSFGWYSPQHHLIAWAYSSLKIYLNPYIEVLETPFDIINFNPYDILRAEKTDKKVVACVPQLFVEGYKEIGLDKLCVKILSVIYKHPGEPLSVA